VEIDTVFGLPAHPLLVHGAVVLVPLAALGSIAVAFVPFLRRRLGWLVAAAAFGAMAMIPFVTGSGEAFEERVEETDLVERHTELGDGLLPWVIGLFASILLVMVLDHLATRRARSDGPGAAARSPAWLLPAALLAAGLTAATGTGAIIQTVRIGHSGSAAVWSGVVNGPAAETGDEDGGSGRGRGRGPRARCR
jgi:hypothetical protein